MDLTTAEYEYQRPYLYPKQEAAVFDPHRYSIIEASTKSGKTIGCVVWILEKALGAEPGQNFWWVAPVFEQADIAYTRSKDALPKGLFDKNDTRRIITLPNEARLWYKSADRPDALYGDDVWGVVMDEASRIKTEAWYAVRTTLTYTRGQVRVIGNVKGRKNWAYKLGRRALNGHKGMAYHVINCWDAVAAGVLDRVEVEAARDELPAHIFRELYECVPSDDGGNPFGLQHIEACATDELSTAPVEAWGWDLAKHRNFSVGVGLDGQGRIAAFERFQDSWEGTFKRIVSATGDVPALLDSTPGSVGDPIIDRLHGEGHLNFKGYPFSTNSKQTLMLGLAAAIQRREVSILNGVMRNEMEAFEYEHKPNDPLGRVLYRVAEGMHDDCVDGLALASYCLTTHRKVEIPVVSAIGLPKVDYDYERILMV